jgi:hypothetical protein
MNVMQLRSSHCGIGAMLILVLGLDHGNAGATDSMSVAIDREAGAATLMEGQLEITSNHDGHVPAFGGSTVLRKQRHDVLSLSGAAGYKDLVGVKLRGDFVDLWHSGQDETDDFAFAALGDLWRENTVGDTEINLSSFSGRVSFTLRRASSRYRASESYLKNLKGSEKRDGRRFTDEEEFRGSASLYRADARLWEAQNGNLSVFAQQSEVDLFFESVALAEDDEEGGPADKKDPFAKPNRATTTVGTVIGFGPMQVTLQRDTVRKLENDEGGTTNDDSRELRQGASIWVDLDDLRHRAGETFQGTLWGWAPDSVWFDFSNGRVVSPVPDDPADAADDLSFGASWNWSSAYASAGYWQSAYDSRGPGIDAYDWAGHGVDVSLGVYDKQWSVDASIGMTRSKSLAPDSQALDGTMDGSLWFTLQPDGLPDVSTGLSIGRYGYDYLAYDGLGRLAYNEVYSSDLWELGIDLDFSKSLTHWKAPARPSLKMTYRCGNDFYIPDGSLEVDHVIAVLFQLKL